MFGIFSNYPDALYTVLVLIILSIVMRQVLALSGQNWVRTFSHTATLLTLPILTYVVTTVISGNLALSLGMIGALSIVRFRNPVKSPFELSAYFMSITMGISASVNMQWLFILCFSVFLALATIYSINFFMKLLLGRPWFSYSFSEGNRLSTINISSPVPLENILQNKDLISAIQGKEGYEYCIASNDYPELVQLYSTLSENHELSSLKLLR
jgi:hypothetical protein